MESAAAQTKAATAQQIAEQVRANQPAREVRKFKVTHDLLPNGRPNPLSYFQDALADQEKRGYHLRERIKQAETEELDWRSLRAKTQLIVRMAFAGATNRDIAECTGMSVQSVARITRSPLAKRYMQALHKSADMKVLEAQQELVNLSATAVDTYKGVLDGSVPATTAHKLHAADQVLDRIGVSKIGRDNNANVTGPNLSPERLQELTTRAMDAGKELGRAQARAELPPPIEVLGEEVPCGTTTNVMDSLHGATPQDTTTVET